MNDYYTAKVGIVKTSSKKEIKKNIVPKKQKYIDLGYLDSRTKSNPKLMMEMIATYNKHVH
jgi:hypothetical protein